VFIINHEGEILNSKTEWHQPKIIRTTILQGGAEMAGGMMVGCQEAGRQEHSSHTEAAQNVNLTTNQPQHAEATSRTTRAMARAAGGL
jgi:hypothetical protein